METISDRKLKVLFRGWTQIPHSYATVNCFQLVHIYKHFGDKIDIYIEEMEYFRKDWNNVKKLVYSNEYNEIIRNLKQWTGQEVDLVYSITYPYNVDLVQNKNKLGESKLVPKCVFYTSEFTKLDNGYFYPQFANVDGLKQHLSSKTLYFTSPSLWSSLGMGSLGVSDDSNRIITHGVDSSIFKRDTSKRQSIRKFYGVNDNEILLINIGAMTRNKGMLEILVSLKQLVFDHNRKNFKILLKGTGDLYSSKGFLETYFGHMISQSQITKEQMNTLLQQHIIFTDKTLPYTAINELYNAADIYVSPYLAEGFNLTVLEALASGLSVLVPKTGSTREFMNDIYTNGNGKHFINYVHSVIGEHDGARQNIIQPSDITSVLLQYNPQRNDSEYALMQNYIKTNYSWKRVASLLYNYFLHIVNCAASETK